MLSIDNELSPQKASVATLCQDLHRQWLDLFTIIPFPRKYVECLYCAVIPLSILSCFVSFHRVTRHIQFIWSFKSHSYVHGFMHPHINTFMYSHIHAYTTHMHIQHQFTHGCINRSESIPVVSLRFGPRSFQVASSNKRTTWTLSKVSSSVSMVERCH